MTAADSGIETISCKACGQTFYGNFLADGTCPLCGRDPSGLAAGGAGGRGSARIPGEGLGPRERRGRAMLLTFFALVMLISIGVLANYAYMQRTDRVATQLVRVALGLALCAWVYGGSVIARWAAIVLLGSGGLFTLVLVLLAGGVLVLQGIDLRALNPPAMLLGVAGGACYVLTALVLLAAPSVKSFLAQQRARRRPGPRAAA